MTQYDPRRPNPLAPQQNQNPGPFPQRGGMPAQTAAQQATPSGGQAPGPSMAPPSPGGDRIDPSAAAVFKGNYQYDPANPQRALQNSMIASGMNPFSSNPVLRNLMAAAPGLANSFMVRGAQGNFGDNTEEGIAGRGGLGSIFSNFLRQALTSSGGISGALRNFDNGTGQQTGDVQNALRGAWNAVDEDTRSSIQGGNAFHHNVFAQTLKNMIENDPTNGAAIIASMYTPFMNPTMSRAYGGRMEQEGYMAPNRQDWTNTWDNPFNYLIGRQAPNY